MGALTGKVWTEQHHYTLLLPIFSLLSIMKLQFQGGGFSVTLAWHRQSGTLHFYATYGWSRKIVTFCTSKYLLQAEIDTVHSYKPNNLFNCYGVLTRGHHLSDFAKSHNNLMYQTDKNINTGFTDLGWHSISHHSLLRWPRAGNPDQLWPLTCLLMLRDNILMQ